MDALGYKRHSTLYFPDGNICLSAELPRVSPITLDDSSIAAPDDLTKEPTGLLFRVHRSVLSLHSHVFRDMFSMPDLSGSSEVYDGLALVRMPDSANDLESLLGAFYIGYTLPYPKLDPRTPEGVRNILLMANKYQVDTLRKQIVDRLESDWPQTLLDWEIQQAEVAALKEYLTRQDSKWVFLKRYAVDEVFPEPASAIRLARDCNVPSILPAAFYQLSRLTINDDWDRLRKSRWSFTSPRRPGFRTAKWSMLDGHDMRCLLQGKDAISNYTGETYLPTFCAKDTDTDEDEDMDEDYEGCDIELNGYGYRLHQMFNDGRDKDLLVCIRMIEKDLDGHSICTSCNRIVRKSLNGEKVWERLSEWFNFAA